MVLSLIGISILLAVGWVLLADRRIVWSLRRSGATKPEKAISLKTTNPLFQWRLRRLRSATVIGVAGKHRIFLNEAGWTRFTLRRRKRLALAGGLAAAAVLAWYIILPAT